MGSHCDTFPPIFTIIKMIHVIIAISVVCIILWDSGALTSKHDIEMLLSVLWGFPQW